MYYNQHAWAFAKYRYIHTYISTHAHMHANTYTGHEQYFIFTALGTHVGLPLKILLGNLHVPRL